MYTEYRGTIVHVIFAICTVYLDISAIACIILFEIKHKGKIFKITSTYAMKSVNEWIQKRHERAPV